MVKKCYKKLLCTALVITMMASMTACSKKESKPLYFYQKTAKDIAGWSTMATPEKGSGQGTVTMGDNAAVIKAAADGWGGVQSEKLTLDLTKDPMLMIQIKENADGFKWGAKFVPADPKIDDHKWGFYLFEDNNFKYNNYAATDIKAKLGTDFIDAYGEKVEGYLWIFAAGSADATVEVSSLKMFNQK